MYEVLKDRLKWIELNYGDILAFDQSLPHGYSLNKEKIPNGHLIVGLKD